MGCTVGDWAFWLWGTHLTQANTSTAKVLRSSPAQSTPALRSFLVSCLAAAWGATLAFSSPAWGTRGGCYRAPRMRPEGDRRSARVGSPLDTGHPRCLYVRANLACYS